MLLTSKAWIMENVRYYTYNEIRDIAISKGISNNKVSIGIWAKLNGFIKVKQKIENNKIVSVYMLDNDINKFSE